MRRFIVSGLVFTLIAYGALTFYSNNKVEMSGGEEEVVDTQRHTDELSKQFHFDKSKPPLDIAKAARLAAKRGEYELAIAMAGFVVSNFQPKAFEKPVYYAYVMDDLAAWYLTVGDTTAAKHYSTEASALAKQLTGEDSVAYASLLSTQASVDLVLGKVQAAKKSYQVILEIYSANLPDSDVRLAKAQRNLAIAKIELADYQGAIPDLKNALAILANDNKKLTPQVAGYQIELAKAHRLNDQIELAKQIVKILSDEVPGLTTQKETVWQKVQLEKVSLAIYDNDLSEAEKLLDNILEVRRLDGSKLSPLDEANVLYQRGFIYILKGQLVEAEALYRKVLALYRKQLGVDHPAIARTLHSLAIVYKNIGLVEQAEEYYQLAAQSHYRVQGAESPAAAATELEYSLLLAKLNKGQQALQTAESSAAVFSAMGKPWLLQQGYSRSAMGTAFKALNKKREAIVSFEMAKRLVIEARGEQSVDLPPIFMQLAELYIDTHQLDFARKNIDAAIALYEHIQARTPFALASAFMIKAQLLAKSGQMEKAKQIADESIGIMSMRLKNLQGRLQDLAREEQIQSRKIFDAYLHLIYPLYQSESEQIVNDMLLAAQYPIESGTAAAIAKMAERFAEKNDVLAMLIKERELLLQGLSDFDHAYTDQLTGKVVQKKSLSVSDRDAMQMKLHAIETRLENQFSDYVQLIQPLPVVVNSVQSVLSDGEAVFIHNSSAHGSTLFLISKRQIEIQRTDLTAEQIAQLVSAIRKSVDLANVETLDDLPEFAMQEAFQLYEGLFQPFSKTLNQIDQLITVFDGAMQNMNPALLLKSRPARPIADAVDYRQLDFLGNDISISVSPSLSAIVYLRQLAATQHSANKLLGIGDPDLDTKSVPTRTVQTGELASTWALDFNPDDIRSALGSLPDTRTELNTIANLVGEKNSDLFFRDDATERLVKTQNLTPYNIVAFATHGLLSGEFKGLSEPALVFTPPASASEMDDGLLTASEITELKLQANWVILSACNTAGPNGRPGAEGLSGLAKSFFYSGAKALLVSHWSVSSDATTAITTTMFNHLKNDKALNFSGALRKATLDLKNNSSEAIYAHPAFWAPFTLVGLGNQRLH